MRLPDADAQRADEILGAVWTRVQPFVHGMTKTSWRGKYRAIALDLARAGCNVEQVLDAQTSASQRLEKPVYSLRIVQDELVRRSVPGRFPASTYQPLRDDE